MANTAQCASNPDHMHVVAALLRPGSVEKQHTVKTRTRHMSDHVHRPARNERVTPPRRKRHQPTPGNCDSNHELSPVSQSAGHGMQAPALYRHPVPLLPMDSSEDMMVASTKSRRLPKDKTSTPFPLLACPPEIRNTIYRNLLTTKSPIEFTGLTGRNGASHRAQWSRCTSTKARRKYKRLFLEILRVCRQIHDEATGIIYGCNVFKYRNDANGGAPRSVILPTRHLSLLKHVKISIISHHSAHQQHEQIADFIRQFLKASLVLETFEFTWFAGVRISLTQKGSVCQALQLLQVERQIVIIITGEARMEKAMQMELEGTLSSQRIEIRRPVKPITGEELSDEERL